MAKKMQRLSPSLREKKRYLVFKVLSKAKLNTDITLKQIKSEIVSYFGQKGMADAGIQLLKETYKKDTGIIRVSHKYINQLKTALMFITKINEIPVIVKSVTVSGILKKAKQ